MRGGFGYSERDQESSPAGGLGAGPAVERRHGGVRIALAAGTLSIALLAGFGASMAAAANPSASGSAVVEPGPDPTPLTLATPKPATGTKPGPQPKPSLREETPDYQQPSGPTMGQPQPGGQSPGDPNPLRPDEPPAAAVLFDPAASPGNQAGVGPHPTPRSRPSGPFPWGVDSPPERIRLILAAATVSGIAALSGWLLLRGRRRDQGKTPAPAALGAIDAPGPEGNVDVEQLLNASDGARRDRQAGTVSTGGPAPLWQAEDDRPRWVRRLDEQSPARSPARLPPSVPDDESMPWQEPVAWNADDGAEEVPR